MEKGKFIVIEGVDGSGKSSTIQKAGTMIDQKNMQITSGFSHDSEWKQFIDNHPHSLLYYLTLLHHTYTTIKPALKSGKHVIQDRYKQTVDTYEPDASFVINKLFVTLAEPLFLQPDIYIQFLADIETIVERLERKNEQSFSEYHQTLIDNPSLIEQRQKRYEQVFSEMKEPKYQINTSQTNVEVAAAQLVSIFERNQLC